MPPAPDLVVDYVRLGAAAAAMRRLAARLEEFPEPTLAAAVAVALPASQTASDFAIAAAACAAAALAVAADMRDFADGLDVTVSTWAMRETALALAVTRG